MILFFGLLRPYKGLDLLLEAFRQVEGAELWIVGNPRMDVAPLRAAAAAAPGRVRFVTRFIEDAEIPAIFRRADLVVLPYRDAEHSGVLYTGLAFGKPLVLSAVGGFPEVAATGAARLVPPGDATALASALSELTADPAARERLAAAARAGRGGPLLLGRRRRPDPRAVRRADPADQPFRCALCAPWAHKAHRKQIIAAMLAAIFWVSAALIVYTHLGYPLRSAPAASRCAAPPRTPAELATTSCPASR